MHVLAATSQKSKRISHSTSHAETLAAAKAIPIGQLGALRLAEPELCAQHGYRQKRLAPLQLLDLQEKGLVPIPHDHVIDCMDLWELSCGLRGIPQDKSQRLGVLHIREERRQLRLRRLYHLPTAYMLADMLTKREGADSKTLLQLASSGFWNVGGHARVRQGFGIATTTSTTDSFRTPSSTDFTQQHTHDDDDTHNTYNVQRLQHNRYHVQRPRYYYNTPLRHTKRSHYNTPLKQTKRSHYYNTPLKQHGNRSNFMT